jgi:hypothetical protein
MLDRQYRMACRGAKLSARGSFGNCTHGQGARERRLDSRSFGGRRMGYALESMTIRQPGACQASPLRTSPKGPK